MVREIMALLQQRKPNQDANKGAAVENRLKEMAVRLEDYLWKRSQTIEEYQNRNTLKHRLQVCVCVCVCVYVCV